MSASREKQNRQELAGSDWVDPKTVQDEQQHKKEKRSSILYGIIAVVFVIVAIAAIIWRSNVIPKYAAAATIDGEKYTAAEVSFYYQNVYYSTINNLSYMTSYFGLDTSSSLKEQTITEDAANMLPMMGLTEAEVGQTWHDYFVDQALNLMATVQVGLAAAEAEGFVYPAGVQAQYDESMATLENAALTANASLDSLLQTNFGTFMTEEVYTKHLMRLLQFSAYSTAHNDSLTYTDDEINAAYDEAPYNYDKVSCEYVAISGAAQSTTDADGNSVEPTEEEKTAAKDAALAKANQILDAYNAGGNLEDLAGEDGTYSKNENYFYAGDMLSEWFFSQARTTGDATVLESGSIYYVAVFHDRFRDEYDTIDVRHILIPFGSATLSSDDEGYEAEQNQLKADAKAEAEDLLAQWKSGEATEESFAALAMEHSIDSSKYEGGLYTGVYQGQMVQTFNDWCFDASRKAGDTGVVETQYGAHVMYFVGKNLPYWQSMVVSNMKAGDYYQWEENLPANSTITKNALGMKFVG